VTEKTAFEKPAFQELWDYGDAAGTETKMREALAAMGADSPGLNLELKTQISRTLGLQQKFGEAQALLDEVQAALAPEMETARVRYLLERGRVFRSSGSPEKANVPFEEAYELAARVGLDYYTVDAAHMMAILSTGEAAEEWFRRGVAAAEASSNEAAQGWLGPLYNNLGWTYHDGGDYEAALGIFEKSLAWRRNEGREPGIRIARYCVAKTHRSLGRVEEALAENESILADFGKDEAPDGFVHEEMGECLYLLGRKDDAAPHFAKAYELLSDDPWLQRDEPDRLKRLQELGEVAP